MDVRGIGIDIVEINRLEEAIERHPRLLARLFTSGERDYCLAKRRPYLHFAVRFAAKEAAMKALGTGFRGIGWTDLEVDRDQLGKPSLRLVGRAASEAERQGIGQVLISLSFGREAAIASAIALAAHQSEAK